MGLSALGVRGSKSLGDAVIQLFLFFFFGENECSVDRDDCSTAWLMTWLSCHLYITSYRRWEISSNFFSASLKKLK